MRKFILAVLLFAPSVWAQEFSFTSSISRASIAKAKIRVFYFTDENNSVRIEVKYQDSSNNTITDSGLSTVFNIPSAAGAGCTSATTLAGLASAMNNTVGGETGTEPRKQQARILGYLNTQGCFSQAGTLVP